MDPEPDAMAFLECSDPIALLYGADRLSWHSAGAQRCLADSRTTEDVRRWCADLTAAARLPSEEGGGSSQWTGSCSAAFKVILRWRAELREQIMNMERASAQEQALQKAPQAAAQAHTKPHQAVIDAVMDSAATRQRLIAERWSSDPRLLLADLQGPRRALALDLEVVMPSHDAGQGGAGGEEEEEEGKGGKWDGLIRCGDAAGIVRFAASAPPSSRPRSSSRFVSPGRHCAAATYIAAARLAAAAAPLEVDLESLGMRVARRKLAAKHKPHPTAAKQQAAAAAMSAAPSAACTSDSDASDGTLGSGRISSGNVPSTADNTVCRESSPSPSASLRQLVHSQHSQQSDGDDSSASDRSGDSHTGNHSSNEPLQNSADYPSSADTSVHRQSSRSPGASLRRTISSSARHRRTGGGAGGVDTGGEESSGYSSNCSSPGTPRGYNSLGSERSLNMELRPTGRFAAFAGGSRSMSQPLPVARLADRCGPIEQPQPQPQQPRGMAVSLSVAVTAASVGKASRRSERSNRNRKVGGGDDDSGGGGRLTGKIAPRTHHHHRRASHAVMTKAKRTWTTPAGTGRQLGGRGDGVRRSGGGGAVAAVPFDRDRNLFAYLLPPMASDNANMLTLGVLGGGLAMSPGAAAELRYERRQRMEEEEEQQPLNGASSRSWATDSACSSLGSDERLQRGQHNALSGSAAQSTTSSYSASQSGWADSEHSFGGSERDSSVNGSMSATGSMCSETEQSDHE